MADKAIEADNDYMVDEVIGADKAYLATEAIDATETAEVDKAVVGNELLFGTINSTIHQRWWADEAKYDTKGKANEVFALLKTNNGDKAKANEAKHPTIHQVDEAKGQMVTKGSDEAEGKAAAEGHDTAQGQVVTEGKVAAKSWARGNVVAKNRVDDKSRQW